MNEFVYRIVAINCLSGAAKIVLDGNIYKTTQAALDALPDIVEEKCIELRDTEPGDFQFIANPQRNSQEWEACIYDLTHHEYGRPEDVIRYFVVRESAGPEKTAEWLADTPFSCLCSACGHARYGTPTDDDAVCPGCGAKMLPHKANIPIPMWTVVWNSDRGKSWERLPLLAAVALVENLGAYGVDELYIYPPTAGITVEEMEEQCFE